MSDCVSLWLKLISNATIMEDVRKEIKKRFQQVSTPQHLLAYLIDHRRIKKMTIDVEPRDDEQNSEESDNSEWPCLSDEQADIARTFVSEREEDFVVVLAAYETADDTMFPKVAFNKSMYKLTPRKYWNYIQQISTLEPVKRFCNWMRAISSCPPSSAGIERLFSSTALVHTKLRNRLSNERVAKLVRVYRHLGAAEWKNTTETAGKEDDIDVDDDLELLVS